MRLPKGGELLEGRLLAVYVGLTSRKGRKKMKRIIVPSAAAHSRLLDNFLSVHQVVHFVYPRGVI